MKNITKNYNFANNFKLLVIFSFFFGLFLTNCGSGKNKENSNVVSNNRDAGVETVSEEVDKKIEKPMQAMKDKIDALEHKVTNLNKDTKDAHHAANIAHAQAIQAKKESDDAKKIGKKADNKASNASKKADTAKSKANKANITAADAKSKATSAKSKANKASVDSKNAKDKSKKASKDSAIAKATADSAHAKATKAGGNAYIINRCNLKVKIVPDLFFKDQTNDKETIAEELGNVLVTSQEGNKTKESRIIMNFYLGFMFKKLNQESSKVGAEFCEPLNVEFIKLTDAKGNVFEDITLNTKLMVHTGAEKVKPKENKKVNLEQAEKIMIDEYLVIIPNDKTKGYELKKYKNEKSHRFANFKVKLDPANIRSILSNLVANKTEGAAELEALVEKSSFSKILKRTKTKSQQAVINYLKKNPDLMKAILKERFKGNSLMASIEGKKIVSDINDINIEQHKMTVGHFKA